MRPGDVGIAVAAGLVDAVADKYPAVVISSPLERAVATAHTIADAAHAPVAFHARWAIATTAPWPGVASKPVTAASTAPGVEPLAAVATRAHKAFEELVAENWPGPIVMVSHDAFNSALLAQIDPTLAEIGQRTACYNQLSYVDSAWRVDAYDVKPE